MAHTTIADLTSGSEKAPADAIGRLIDLQAKLVCFASGKLVPAEASKDRANPSERDFPSQRCVVPRWALSELLDDRTASLEVVDLLQRNKLDDQVLVRQPNDAEAQDCFSYRFRPEPETLALTPGNTYVDETVGRVAMNATAGLEKWIDKSLSELPEGLREIVPGIVVAPWDRMTPNQRRDAARGWEETHDPVNDETKDRLWDESSAHRALEARLEQWRSLEADAPSELDLKEKRVAELEDKLRRSSEEKRAAPPRPTEQRDKELQSAANELAHNIKDTFGEWPTKEEVIRKLRDTNQFPNIREERMKRVIQRSWAK